MHPILRTTQKHSLPFYSNLIDHCLSLKSLDFAKTIHARLIKTGFNTRTFLGNRIADLYSQFGNVTNVLQSFDDISSKNIVSWNICLKGFVKSGDIESARLLFEEMPERDVVSWNSMIFGYASSGFVDSALQLFLEMQSVGVRPSGYTFSILVSHVRCACHGKQIHGSMIRRALNFLNVVGNSLIDMYGKLRLLEYAFSVFLTMEELDIISWNSLILSCCKSGREKLALEQFHLMRNSGLSPDEFTLSTVIAVCSDLRALEKGKQILCLCVKVGFLSNTIVSSAAIDLFSKCNRVEDSIRIFEEMDVWDSALCNSAISSYARHGLEENALLTFVLALRENIKPTEFTLSCVISCASVFLPVEQGSHLHSLVVKLGFESDSIVASSLVEMYGKYGLIDTAKNIFCEMVTRDLISWNTMIMGLAYNGRVVDCLNLFKKLLEIGPRPDQITVAGVLLACCYCGYLDEGMALFSSMDTEYGILPREEHYTCIVDLLSQAGKIKEAIEILEATPLQPTALILESLLHASVHADLKLTEKVAEKLMDLEPHSSLPYVALGQAYEMRGRWESLIRVRKVMNSKTRRKVVGCSWIGIKKHVFVFEANKLVHHGSNDIHLILGLLTWELENEECGCL